MFGTKLHWITFLCLVLEFVILVIQIASCISRRKDNKRVRFFILISLFIFFNLSNGFLSDSTPHFIPFNINSNCRHLSHWNSFGNLLLLLFSKGV